MIMDAVEDLTKINEQEIDRLVSDILASGDMPSLKSSTEALMRLYDSAESLHGYVIRERLYSAVIEGSAVHQIRFKGLKQNAVIIPPEHAVSAMIPVYVKMNGNHYDFTNGMKKLLNRCDEFTAPIHPAITEAEIRATLSAAQRAFGMVDIIAPECPLRIYRFGYSHIERNCECGILNGDSRQSVVFLYHPRENDVYDRIFIFAHELGHALHYSLTGDIDIIPDGYDNFNESLGVKLDNLKAKQEGFADAAAIAILGSKNSRLKSHLPTQWSKDISPMFVRYFDKLCEAGRLS
jgi:hypothetical protein